MNAERLHAIVIVLNQEMNKGNTPTKLQELITALQNVVTQPQQSSYQQTLAQSRNAMYASVTNTQSDSFSPSWRQILREIGGEDLFGRQLKLNIENVFARNQITPAVALEELQKILKTLQAFKNALDQAASSLRHFHIGDEKLGPGQCEIGILIPRAAVNNQLLEFADELNELGFILNTFSEVATGKKDDLSIRTISSSDLLVYLEATAPYAACLAVAIERVVTLYKQLLEIRKLRLEIKKQGVPDEEMTGVEKYANDLMKNGIEKIAVEVVNEYHKKDDKDRKNELTNAVRISLNKVANRIDHGFNLEVRVEPVAKGKDEEKVNVEIQGAIAAIQSATANMQFMKLEGQPILKLPEGKEEKREEEGVRHVKVPKGKLRPKDVDEE